MKEELRDSNFKDIFVEKSSALQKTSSSSSNAAKVLIALTGGIAIGITVVCASFVAPAFRRFCLPYVPATPNQIKNVLSLIPKSSKGTLLDIGSGDGRIVFAANKHGLKETHGIELNTWLVLYSKIAALKESSKNRPRFYRGNLWNFNVSPYDYVVCFGVEQMMADLEKKILSEAQQGCEVILCRFPFPNLMPDKTVGCGVDTVWLYCIKQQQNTQRICEKNKF